MRVKDKNIALRIVKTENPEKKSQKIIGNKSENNTVYDITLEKDDFSLCIDAKDYSRFVKIVKEQMNLDESRDIVSYLLYCQKVTKSLNQIVHQVIQLQLDVLYENILQ